MSRVVVRGRFGLLGLLGLLVSFVVGPSKPVLALTSEDRVFVRYLIQDLRYYDTARRYLESQRKSARTRDQQAAIDASLIDLLKAEGRKDEALAALEEFQRRYPDHARAAMGSLEQIAAEFEEVATDLAKIATAPSAEARAAIVAGAKSAFADRVRGPLDALVAELEGELEKAKDADADEIRRRRDLAELSRARFQLLFASFLPEGSADRTRSAEDALALATAFVDDRGYFYIMQFEAVIQQGLCLEELGRHDEAADTLSILFDIFPPTPPPFDESTVTAIRDIRLRAILFGVRAYNKAGQYGEALGVVRRHIEGGRADDPFSLKSASDTPALAGFAALLELEHAVALAGTGEGRQGLDLIQSVIARAEARGEAGRATVIDAQRALSQIAASGTVRLSGSDYYRVGIGLKSEVKLAEALRMFQRALATLSPDENAEFAPLCLSEIGQLHFIREDYIESANAFHDLCAYFPSSPLLSQAATNFLAATTKAINERGAHGGLLSLKAKADEISRRFGSGFGALEAQMAEADRAMNQGRYADARTIYASVPRTYNDAKVPFYYRAQFSAWWMLILQYQREGTPELAEEFPAAIDALDGGLPLAIAEGDVYGAAIGALALGQIRTATRDHAGAVEALKLFLGPLSSDTSVICPALGYLVDAAVAAGDSDAAVAAFRTIDQKCKGDPARGFAALTLAEHFETEEPAVGAVYLQIYTATPEFTATIDQLDPTQKAQSYLEIAGQLIDAGEVSAASIWIDRASAIAPPGELERQLLFLRARTEEQEKDFAAVVKTLETYIEKYTPNGSNQEDPHVYRKLALAYIQVGKETKSTRAFLLAERNFNIARSLMFQRAKAVPDDPSFERAYWLWAYQWLQVKLFLGQKDPAEALYIVAFVDEWKHTDMGGRLEAFLALHEKAEKYANRKK